MDRFNDYRCDSQITIEDYIKREAAENPTLDNRTDANASVNKDIRYKQIVEILKEYPRLTAKEVAVRMRMKGFTPSDERNFSAPRLTELSKKGVVEPVGKKKCECTGKTVAVYMLREQSN